MKNLKYIYFTLGALGILGCEPEFDQPLEDTPIAQQSSGEADFSTYVALGNSLTAGFADGALYTSGQENSFANILATQMQVAGGGNFSTPFMNDDIGGFAEDTMGFPPRFIFDPSNRAPVRINETPTTSISAVLQGPFQNMGVPGAKSFHLAAPGYGNLANLTLGLANPYFTRFASSPDATVIGDALAQQPTFFTMWIGNNDVLGYATAGGVVLDSEGNPVLEADNSQKEAILQPTPTTTDLSIIPPPGSEDISNPAYFGGVYTGLATALASTNAKGVLINVPNVTDIPFFTTVPNNALVLNAREAAGLTGFFQLYASIVSGRLQLEGISKAQADSIASQYAITFNPGRNNFLIQVPENSDNPLENPSNFRQMTDEELLLLTIDQNALRTEGYGSANITPEIEQILGTIAVEGPDAFNPADAPKILAALNPISDRDALDIEEIGLITQASNAYNQIIESTASANPNFALLDTNSLLSQLANRGISAENGVTITSDFVSGGAFSLDGVHLTPRGNAFIANELIRVINSNFGATLQEVDPNQFKTVTLQ